jgi:uncharacterized protein (DUF433 family)
MTALDWSKCSAVESIPGKVSGAWVFKNTRMPVSLVFENLGAGATIDEIMDWFHLTREQIVAVLEFAAAEPRSAPTPETIRTLNGTCSFSLITVHRLRCAMLSKAHVVVEAIERGWERLGNGALLDAAEAAAFEILVTGIPSLPSCERRRVGREWHQQNSAGRKIAVVVFANAQWPILRRHVDRHCAGAAASNAMLSSK